VQTLLTARAALLQALTFPGYGTELISRVRLATGGLVRLRMGSVYPALKALEQKGFVRGQTVRPVRAGRPRKYYELTSAGVAAANGERAALAGLLRTTRREPSLQEKVRMCERLLRSARLSASVGLLRARVLAGRRLR
jgi:PadR family transcriptional regulator